MFNYFKNLFKSNSKAINNPPNNSNNHTINENTNYPGPCAAFLSGEENCCGTIIRFTEFSDDQLENSHSWIQYAFPLQEPSEYNSKAPVLTDEEIEWIKSETGERARINLRLMYLRILRFYGFEYKPSLEEVSLIPSDNFDERSKIWLTPFNHNYKRLTRILKCLTLCGMRNYAKELFNALEKLYQDHEDIIGDKTFDYWKQAVEIELPQSH